MTRTLIGIAALALTTASAADPFTNPTSTRFTAADLSLAPAVVVLQSSAAAAPQNAPAGSAPAGAQAAGGSGAPAADGSGIPGAADTPGASVARTRFGEAGSLRFNIYGDGGSDFDDSWFLGAQFGVSWFFLENLSLDVQLEQYGFFQKGGDAYGIGPALLFRWHFLAYDAWSLYADGGCGFFYATDDVPANGSQFNFTPRIGIGASFEVMDNVRLMTGVRWFHISNANTSTPNPGRDSMELYAGLSLPF